MLEDKMKLGEFCAVVCALVASLGSAGAADDFKTLYARADLGGSMRSTTLMGGSHKIKEQKFLAPDRPAKKKTQFNSLADSNAAKTAVLSSTEDLAGAGVSPSADIRASWVRPTTVTRRGEAGRDFRAGNVVVGVELDVETMKLYDGKSTIPTYISYCCAATSLVGHDAVKTDWVFTGRPRFGYVSGYWLVYGTGGMALTNRIYEEVTDAVVMHGNDGINEIRTGWTAGGGIEYKRAHLALRGEYLYAGFAGMSAVSVSSITVTQTANLKPQIVRAALSFRF
jgi:opacity protein-like surface antigen